MTENDRNRKWLIASRVGEPSGADRRSQEAETLLYYQTQLEAELSFVRRQLRALGLGSAAAV